MGLENLFNLESLGIRESSDASSVDELKIKEFKEGIEFRDGKYYVELPWYNELIEAVPSNHEIALAILRRVSKKLLLQNLTKNYGDVFRQQLTDGIIEEIKVDPPDYHQYIWIPHRPVFKEDLQVTTKMRVVFNCSLKVNQSPSLNESAFPGVDLLSSLFCLLCSFRSNQFAAIADIRQAFLQIKLKLEKDCNRFCFFWEENNQLRCFRYSSIVFGFSCSPFILNYVLKHHASTYPSDLCTQLLNSNFYMDDFIFTSSSPQELKEIYQTATHRLAEGGFELRSWNTNHPEIRKLMLEDGKAVEHSCHEERVLGYLYDFTQDTLRLCDFAFEEVSSKRDLLSQISKVFDPLSLFSPVTVRGRLLMKETWERKIPWDNELDDDLQQSWLALKGDLELLKGLSFPRSSFCSLQPNLTLNVFCDASTSCYGFAVYVVTPSSGAHLLVAKNKVAPLKGRTLPCLELLSVYLALKCLPQILSSFRVQFKVLHIFSDSQIVLAWISAKILKAKQIFVRNRVKDIHRFSSGIGDDFKIPPSFHYVRSEENPADLLTRGLSFRDFSKRFDLWCRGPDWLDQPEIYWPAGASTGNECMVNASSVAGPQEIPCIDVRQFSSLSALLRRAALCFKFIYKLRRINLDGVDATSLARRFFVKTMQKESFPQELEFLRRVQEDPPSRETVPPLVSKLNLFVDDEGLIRSKGRLARSNYYDAKILNPVLLAKSHHFTVLVIRDAHFRCKHLGIQATLTNVRLQGFWITSARNAIKTAISDCIICKKFNNFSFSYPKFTNFTKAQMKFIRPYEQVGVDFTGHLWVKDERSGEKSKYYILIYTCLHVRAVHLDLLPDMSTKSFLLSFKRFSQIYGNCRYLYSDNARSFVQAGDALENSLLSDEGQEFLRQNDMKHRTIPLYAPWVGAAWERLIRVVKDCLYKTLGKEVYGFFDLLALLADIENCVNSRPLTYVSSSNDLLPLTPNSFLKIHEPVASPLAVQTDEDPEDPLWQSEERARDALVASFEHLYEKYQVFRKRWFDEYLLSLREFSRDLYITGWENRVKVGDVVLIKHPAKSRPFWQMGCVTRLMEGDDGRVRSVYVRKSGGAVNLYPINVLFPLELSITHTGDRRTESVPNTPPLPPPPEPELPRSAASPIPGPSGVSKRPKRASAVVAEERMQKWLS